MALSRFFIDRPVFAWVIAIVIMLAGGIAAFILADRAISHHRPARGGDQRHLSGRRRRHGAELRHPGDRAAANGPGQPSLFLVRTPTPTASVSITATFAPGTNPDIAQVQVQNKVQQAVPLLPSQVQQIGVTVAKAAAQLPGRSSRSMTPPDRYDNVDISDFMVSKMQDPLSRASPAWATPRCFGAQYAMRIWLDPYKLHNYLAAAVGRVRRHPGAERAGFGRPDRRPARRAGPGDERHRHGPVAAADAGAVPQHHPQDHARRRRGASVRCGARRAGRRHLWHRQPR